LNIGNWVSFFYQLRREDSQKGEKVQGWLMCELANGKMCKWKAFFAGENNHKP